MGLDRLNDKAAVTEGVELDKHQLGFCQNQNRQKHKNALEMHLLSYVEKKPFNKTIYFVRYLASLLNLKNLFIIKEDFSACIQTNVCVCGEKKRLALSCFCT